MKKVNTHGTAKDESDTYDLISRENKEKIGQELIKNHWELRAQRPDVQAVMSARHSLAENKYATQLLKEDIFGMLGGYAHGSVVELGTGIGRMTQELADRADRVVTCDLSPTMIERAKRKSSKILQKKTR